MLRHVVGRACIEIRNEIPYFNSLNFFGFISKELLFNEAYSVEGIDSLIHRVEKSFKIQLLRHVVEGSSIEIRHGIPNYFTV